MPLALALAACGPPSSRTPASLTLPPPDRGPDGAPAVTAETRDAHVYAFYVAAPGTPERRAQREAIVRWVLARAQETHSRGGTLRVASVLADGLHLFEPWDLAAPLDSPALRKLIEWIRPVANRSGMPEDTLVIAHAALLLDPGDARAAADIEEVTAWRIAAAATSGDEPERLETLAGLYDVVTEVLPAPALVKDLIGWTLRRHEIGPRGERLRTFHDMIRAAERDQRFFSGLTLRVAALAARMGRPEGAVEALEPHRDSPGYLPEVIDKLSGLRSVGTRADAAMALAEALAGTHAEDARRLCAAMRREFPGDGRFAACLGRYYAGRRQHGVAARFMLDAMSAAPDNREFADAALALLAGEIGAGVDRTSWPMLQGLMGAFDVAWARHRAAWPHARPPAEAGAVLRRMADAALVMGDIESARRYIERSLAAQPSPYAYLGLAEISARSGDSDAAVALLESGLAERVETPEGRAAARARLLEELGRVRATRGEGEAADAAFREAEETWRGLAASGAVSAALADVNSGRLMIRRGLREDGLRRIAAAIRAAGDAGGGEVAEVLQTGFIVLHSEGEADLLADLLPAAVTAREIEPNDRVFYALWTLGAFRGRGLPDDPDAAGFLAAIPATGWWLELARLYRGERTFAEVIDSAQTPGQRAEAGYYEALNRLGVGDLDGARELLARVIDSRIYNYIEWEMARRALESLAAR